MLIQHLGFVGYTFAVKSMFHSLLNILVADVKKTPCCKVSLVVSVVNTRNHKNSQGGELSTTFHSAISADTRIGADMTRAMLIVSPRGARKKISTLPMYSRVKKSHFKSVLLISKHPNNIAGILADDLPL